MSPAPSFSFTPVAVLRTPFAEKFGIPRQSGLVQAAEGRVMFAPEYGSLDWVRGLEAFSHVWLITAFHLSGPWTGAATVRPPRLGGNERVGVFASRAPHRPNPISLSLVRLLGVEAGPPLTLHVAGVDAVDGTPVLDVKPYLPWCEAIPDARAEWAGDPPPVRAPNDIVIPAEIAAHIVAIDPAGAQHTLTLIRELLRYDLQPAYHTEPERVYGMTVAGWNVRWRAILPKDERTPDALPPLEVIEARRT